MSDEHYLIVGTFNGAVLFTLAFDAHARSLRIAASSPAQSAHSWLALNRRKDRLYATEWKEVPGVAAYRIVRNEEGTPVLEHLNSVSIASRSGYLTCSDTAVYSAGGATGDVIMLDKADGSLVEKVQELSFVEKSGQRDDGVRSCRLTSLRTQSVLDFGGVRHGAHGADLSPNGRALFVPDIGRNCIWCFEVNPSTSQLTLRDKNVAPRSNDGPRHVWLHPNGRVLYSLQEHSCHVDVFDVDGTKLTWRDGVRIVPDDLHEAHHSKALFWADEVRLSPSSRTLFASTRGLEPKTKGWLAAFALDEHGHVADSKPLALWETPTSGGWANAIEPAPFTPDGPGDRAWLALTDSEQGLVMIILWDGTTFQEVAKVKLPDGAGAATAVWL